jgi:hypothetical protein
MLLSPSAATAAPAATDATLATATADLDVSAKIPGTAWSVDATTRQVVVNVDETVTGAKLDQVRAVAARHGSAVRIETMKGSLGTFVSGGDAILTGGARCSLGFNVRNSAGQFFFLTAGHCTNIGANWTTSGGTTIGPRTGTSFPGNDYGIVRYNNTAVAHPGTVGSQDITTARTPAVGSSA